MFSSALTLLLITPDRIVRADVSGGSAATVSGIWQQERPPADSLATLSQLALRLGGRPAGPVWVLSSEVWTQTLNPASALVAGLSDEEVGKALAFEAEPLSGVSAFDSLVGFVGVPGKGGNKEYWIAQLLAWQRDAVEEIVAEAGGSLAGILHPGGLPRPIGADAHLSPGQSWQRVELWPDAVVCLVGSPAKGVRVHVINADPRHGAWLAQAEEWTALQEPAGDSETLVSTGAFAKTQVEGHRFHSLEEEETLRDWFAAWGSQLASQAGAVPLVAPPARPVSPLVRGLISLAILAAVVCGCWVHYASVTSERERLAKEIQKVQEPGKKKTEYETQFKDQDKKRTELRKSTDQLQSDLALHRTAFEDQRRRIPALLRSLASFTPDEVLVQKIEPSGGHAQIHGLALRPELAMELARKLSQDLAKQGWLVGAPKTTAQVQLEDGGPWQFVLPLIAPGAPAGPVKEERDFRTE